MRKDKYDNIEQLKNSGFQGFIALEQIRNERDILPVTGGVYIVLKPDNLSFTFKDNPEIPKAILDEWVENTILLFIGSSSNLKKRLLQLSSNNHNLHSALSKLHQLPNYKNLLVAWKETGAYGHHHEEEFLLAEFTEIYNRIPFANSIHRPIKNDILQSNLGSSELFLDQETLKKHFLHVINIMRDHNIGSLESNFLLLSYIFMKRVLDGKPRNINNVTSKERLAFFVPSQSSDFIYLKNDILTSHYNLLKRVFTLNNIPVPSILATKSKLLSKMLKDLILYFENIYFDDTSINTYQFGIAYDELIDTLFNVTSAIYKTPSKLRQLMIRLLDPHPAHTIYDPATGVGGFFVEIRKYLNDENPLKITKTFSGQEINPLIYSILAMNLMLNNISLDSFHLGDTISDPKHLVDNSDDILFRPSIDDNSLMKFDRIVCDVPVGKLSKRTYSERHYRNFEENKRTLESSFLHHILASLNNQGKAVLLLPSKILFNQEDYFLRRSLVDNDYIEYIIQLPDNIIKNIPILYSILVISKRKTNSVGKIKFLDLSKSYNNNLMDNSRVLDVEEDFSKYEFKEINNEDVKANDYSLNIGFYSSLRYELLNNLYKDKAKRLKDICSIIRGRKYQDDPNGDKYRFVSSSDLSGDINDHYLKDNSLSMVFTTSARSMIKSKAILFSLIGEINKATIYDPTHHSADELLIGANVAGIIPRDDSISIEYLYYQLYTTEFTTQLAELRHSLTPMISIRELEQIIIPLPSIEEQFKFIEVQKRSLYELEELRHKERLKDLDIKKSELLGQEELIKMLSHNLSPKISGIYTILSSFESFIGSRGLTNEFISDLLNFEEELDLIEGQDFTNNESVKQIIDRCRIYLDYIQGTITRTKEYIFLRDLDKTEHNLKEVFADFLNTIRAEYNNKYKIHLKCSADYYALIHRGTFIELFNPAS